MDAREIVEKVAKGEAHPGWHAFRYDIVWGIAGLAWRVFAVAAFGYGAFLLLREAKNTNLQEYWFIGGFVALFCVIFLLQSIGHIYTLLFAATNMIVLTERGLVHAHRGRAVVFPYSDIRDAKIIYEFGGKRFPEKVLTFIDAQSQTSVELARYRVFGKVEDILHCLQEKLRK